MTDGLTEALHMLPLEFPGIFEMEPKSILYLLNCSKFNQFCSTLRGLVDPKLFCPFCPAERSRRVRQFSNTAGKWGLLQNEFRHRNTEQMWLIVPKHHITNVGELTSEDWASIGELFNACRQEHKLLSGGMMVRFGHPLFHAGTVEHFHLNIIEPRPGHEYRPPFAKEESEHAEDYSRLLGFLKQMEENGGTTWLFSDAGVKETQP